MPPTKGRKRKFDEDVIKTERDTRRATGKEDENDFQEEEPPLKVPRVYGLTCVRDVLLRKSILRQIRERDGTEEETFPFMKLPAEVRNMIYRYLLVSKARNDAFTSLATYRKKEPISLGTDYMWSYNNSTKYWNPGGIEVAILGVNRQIYAEASRILYTENEYQAGVSLRSGFINFREDLTQTRALATRSLRSGRKIDMLRHTGLVYPHVALRLRNLEIIVELKTYLRPCFHTEMRTYESLVELVELVVTRANQVGQVDDLLVQGKKWVVKFDCANIGLVSLSILVHSLMKPDFFKALRDEKLSFRIEGNMPTGWKNIMRQLLNNGATEGEIVEFIPVPEDYFYGLRMLSFFKRYGGPSLPPSIIYDEEAERLGELRCWLCHNFHEYDFAAHDL